MLRNVIRGVGTTFWASSDSFVGFGLVVLCSATPLLGCDPVDEPSRLEQRAAQRSREVAWGASASPTAAASAPPAVEASSPTHDVISPTPKPQASETEPPAPKPPGLPPSALPPPSERVTLALALDPDVVYRTSVVGMVSFPMNDKPTGYAREETVRLQACEGEGISRHCTLVHQFSGFEAEPPAGRFLQGDYDRVAHVRSRHAITATGFRSGVTALDALDPGPAIDPSIDDVLGAELSDVHRFFCIRFPNEPVGVGAKWSDTCTTVSAGTPGKRTVTWELSKLADDPAGGKRAELSYVGTYEQLARDQSAVQRQGTISGTLYFFVDDGQPHLMRETIAVALGRTGVVTKTSINIQFAREDSGAPQGRVRTDGGPFPVRAPPATQQD